MHIEINRNARHGQAIDGTLRINGAHVCHTAENTLAALPRGTWPLLIHTCRRYRRKMPLVITQDTTRSGWTLDLMARCNACRPTEIPPNNNTRLPLRCPMLKPGNGVHRRTDGSIIVGKPAEAIGCLLHPERHFNRLIDRLDKAQNRGETITLTIN